MYALLNDVCTVPVGVVVTVAFSVLLCPGQTDAGTEPAVTGSVCAVTVIGSDVPGHEVVVFVVTVKFPEVLTVIDCVVAPVDHK